MLKNRFFLVAAIAVALIGLWLYFQTRTPPGIAPKGDGSETVALISLATSVVAMITALIGLIQKFLELKKTQRPTS
jgi:hypothetical protein